MKSIDKDESKCILVILQINTNNRYPIPKDERLGQGIDNCEIGNIGKRFLCITMSSIMCRFPFIMHENLAHSLKITNIPQILQLNMPKHHVILFKCRWHTQKQMYFASFSIHSIKLSKYLQSKVRSRNVALHSLQYQAPCFLVICIHICNNSNIFV